MFWPVFALTWWRTRPVRVWQRWARKLSVGAHCLPFSFSYRPRTNLPSLANVIFHPLRYQEPLPPAYWTTSSASGSILSLWKVEQKNIITHKMKKGPLTHLLCYLGTYIFDHKSTYTYTEMHSLYTAEYAMFFFTYCCLSKRIAFAANILIYIFYMQRFFNSFLFPVPSLCVCVL